MKLAVSDRIPRAALITGGARHHAMARMLVEAGFAVMLQCDPDADDAPPAGVIALPANLEDETQTAALLGRAAAALGPIGVLINGAAVRERDAWADATRTTWDMHIATNLRAPFVLIQHFAEALPASREGVVINLLDQRIDPRLVSYTLSKAALWSLTQTMALALAPSIRVNGITPGGITPGGITPGGITPGGITPGGITPGGIAPGGIAAGPDHGAGPEDIGRAALAILALPSMTGQMIVPDGVPPPAA